MIYKKGQIAKLKFSLNFLGGEMRQKPNKLIVIGIAGDCTNKIWSYSLFVATEQHYIFFYPILFTSTTFFFFFSLNTCFYISKIYNTAPTQGKPKRVSLLTLEKNEPYQSRCRIYRNLLQHR